MESTQFLHYQMTTYLGHGPLGHTYQAYDAGLERGVAVKILSQYAFGSDDLRHRWVILQERMRNQPDGPVPIFDWAVDGDRQAVIREHIDGESLAERFLGGGATYQAALSLLLHLAQQIRVIHKSDLVHGNLHPSNVIFDHAGSPHITDPLMPDTVRPWLDGIAPTRRVFVAPEVLRGRIPDRRSDIFALGAIAVYLFVGEQMTVRSDLRLEKLGEFAADDDSSPLRLPDDIPSEVRMVLRLTLAEDPRDRFTDVDSLIATLEQLRQPRRDTSDAAPKKVNPNWYLLIVVATVVLIILWVVLASLRR